MLYLNICRLISVDISQGYLFRATNKVGHISDKPFIGSSVYNRFKQYLKDAGLDRRRNSPQPSHRMFYYFGTVGSFQV